MFLRLTPQILYRRHHREIEDLIEKCEEAIYSEYTAPNSSTFAKVFNNNE